MIVPLLLVGLWSAAVACVHLLLSHNFKLSDVLLGTLSFVVGVSITFRTNSAIERYNKGREHWASLQQHSQTLGSLIWIHADERPDDGGRHDLLAKINCLNLIVAFAVALKHKLRYEPFTHYDDLNPLVGHLDLFARNLDVPAEEKMSAWELTGHVLGLTVALPNPRRYVEEATMPLGNPPLEILLYISASLKVIFENGTFNVPAYKIQAVRQLDVMSDIMTDTERILNTPLPAAYLITLRQITWVYILLLPLLLVEKCHWATIPMAMLAAYIILGISLIGYEIENPFGHDVNDLPLDMFCEHIRRDMDVIMSRPRATMESFTLDGNPLMHPLSKSGYNSWSRKSVREIRAALRKKPWLDFELREYERANPSKQVESMV